MKYLITGGAGFIGIKLTEELLKNNNNQIYIIDNFLKDSSNKRLISLVKNKKIKLIQKNLNNISDYLKIYDFDYIYHFAAMLGVKNVIDNPYVTLKENISTTINLINFSKKQKKLTNKRKVISRLQRILGDRVVIGINQMYEIKVQN